LLTAPRDERQSPAQHSLKRNRPEPYFAAVERAGRIVGAAVWKPPHKLVLSYLDNASEAADAARLLADDLSYTQPELPGVLRLKAFSRAFSERWTQRTGRVHREQTAMRIFQLDAVAHPRRVSGALRRATTDDRDLLIEWTHAFRSAIGEEPEHQQSERAATSGLALVAGGKQPDPPQPPGRAIYVWVGSQSHSQTSTPLSMAACTGCSPNGVRINMVYTPSEDRRRGYATACVAALSQLLVDTGRRYCFLFTDPANPTSNHIYHQIGYRPVCDVDKYAFELAQASASQSRP